MSDYTSIEQRASYGVGRNMGEQLAANPFEGIDITAVQQGLADAFNKAESQVSYDDLNAAFKEINERMQADAAEKAKVLAAEGEAYLEENAKREGVTVLASGLQFEVITEGEGEKPTAESTVRTHYHGTLIDGTVFDSSYDRGQPAEFPVGGVIKGWTEALQLMAVGSKYKLHIPHHLAYGEQGAGGQIAPFSALVFDVELLEIIS
ncbi:FKBP-type peptidyl-prolyl cis-trans isomerase [Psychrobium sp. 1_MG-2023]|uniref:FKBP-type peptidyl-prolyl cis-trans isomerase n=1 Tax=Psychrobium sp. 1_MG-2023 TaxID=3062624 RepID=UPI000C31BE47|nr:FKBP-type peptidyl-prolyl cis-trans isomerase [Psychrobium sp. 1_MG-2023]MDP2561239.1 FKBP-type peptidyl-prolyl cis-trans isomerase [Psychrobium sp. 1_MG-2023]PKF55258.1 peptidylprolyl isomerase [Alteromonadales bacterium alter-6D02]